MASGLDAPSMTALADEEVLGAGASGWATALHVTQVLAEQRDSMATGMPLFRSMKVERMHRDISIPYHEGALAYYKDKSIVLTR